MRLFGFLITIFILLQVQFANAQAVGVGTTTPGARLDITKPGGDTPTLNIRGSANITHFNFGVAEHTYIRGGKAASNVLINDYPGSGNIGFGTASPMTRFHFFNGASGNFFPTGLMALEGNSNTYLNILAPNANETGLLFGKASDAVSGGIVYNNSASLNGLQFRTNGNINRMLIDANGNVGIGNNDPAFKLDVSNRMRIRSGGGFSSAGLYLNNNDNSASPAFIGMHDDNHVGFWGSGMGWGFTMNTNNGALRVNGSEGQPGQILQSSGEGTPVTWSIRPYSFSVSGGHIVLEGNDLCVNIPTIDGYSFILGQASTISYQFTIPLYPSNGSFGGGSRGAISIRLLSAGTTVSNCNSKFSIGESIHITVVGFADLPAGTYTISAKVVRTGTGDGNTRSNFGFLGSSPGCNNMTMQTAQFIAQVFPK